MRLFQLLLTLATTSLALEIPFFSALSLPITFEDYFPPSFTANGTAKQQQQPKKYLHNRQISNACPENFHACTNLGAPGLCCADAAICKPDDAGNVACCPSSSTCSGVVHGVITAGTVNTVGSLIGGGRATGSSVSGSVSSNSAGVVISSNTPTSSMPGASGSKGAFVLNGGSGIGDVARRAEIVSIETVNGLLVGRE